MWKHLEMPHLDETKNVLGSFFRLSFWETGIDDNVSLSTISFTAPLRGMMNLQ